MKNLSQYAMSHLEPIRHFPWPYEYITKLPFLCSLHLNCPSTSSTTLRFCVLRREQHKNSLIMVKGRDVISEKQTLLSSMILYRFTLYTEVEISLTWWHQSWIFSVFVPSLELYAKWRPISSQTRQSGAPQHFPRIQMCSSRSHQSQGRQRQTVLL